MLTFAVAGLVFVPLFLVFAIPPVLVARRDPRRHGGVGRRFLVAGAVAGLSCAILIAISEQLVDQCEAEGNSRCEDVGGVGLISLIAIGFLGVSSVRAYLMYTD